jgi:hypothetical protein
MKIVTRQCSKSYKAHRKAQNQHRDRSPRLWSPSFAVPGQPVSPANFSCANSVQLSIDH